MARVATTNETMTANAVQLSTVQCSDVVFSSPNAGAQVNTGEITVYENSDPTLIVGVLAPGDSFGVDGCENLNEFQAKSSNAGDVLICRLYLVQGGART